MKTQPATAAELAAFHGKRAGQSRLDIETQLVSSILQYLKQVVGCHVVCRRNIGALETLDADGRLRFVKFNEKGQADVWAIGPQGIHIEVEAKQPHKGARSEPTTAQSEWLDDVRATGAIALCVTSLEELAGQLQEEFEKRRLPWKRSWML